LVKDASTADPLVLVGEIAHVAAQSPGGPRRDSAWQPSQMTRTKNLILLCHRCHETVDQQPKTYPVRTKLSTEERLSGLDRGNPWVEERLSAMLLRVSEIPHLRTHASLAL
jgi:hypothetical protein